MAIRTYAQLISDFAANSVRGITSQKMRDFVDSVFPPQYQGFRGFRTTGDQSITTGTWTPVQHNAADVYDTNDFHDPVTNNSRATIPSGLGGLYAIGAHVSFTANATGRRGAQLYLNGATDLSTILVTTNASGSTNLTINTQYALAAGDYVEVRAFQESGGNLTVGGALWIARLGQVPAS